MRFKFLCLLILSSLLCACGMDEEVTIDDSAISVNAEKSVSVPSPSEQFMKETGVSLLAKEVQYNMVNNLDKDFFVEGTLSLCDYYNYGYTNESEIFCGEITTDSGKYSDSWYLYFHRDSFADIYDQLLDNDLDVYAVARVFEKNYKDGQGNMAGIRAIQIK